LDIACRDVQKLGKHGFHFCYPVRGTIVASKAWKMAERRNVNKSVLPYIDKIAIPSSDNSFYKRKQEG